jgi:hypothetical protein
MPGQRRPELGTSSSDPCEGYREGGTLPLLAEVPYSAGVPGEDADLRGLLKDLDPKTRDDLRNVLIRDQADRDAISSRLMRYRDQNGQDWADVIDFLTMYPEARRRVVRLLGELEAGPN